MANKADLSIDYLGVKCENPFFLSSSPVGGCYDMVAKAYESGWGGVFFKTVGRFIADECSPRFDNVGKEQTPWIGYLRTWNRSLINRWRTIYKPSTG